MNIRQRLSPTRLLALILTTSANFLTAQTPPSPSPTPLAPPPQDLGLPYTRSADAQALARIKDVVAVFPGSRYAYVKGSRVRLSETDLLHGEALAKDGSVLAPVEFLSLIDGPLSPPPAVPGDLGPIADRWVYKPSELGAKAASRAVPVEDISGAAYGDILAAAKARNLKATTLASGVILIGAQIPDIPAGDASDALVALFDTPDKLADPDIATKSIPNLARQGKWTDHAKVTPEQLAILNGPETVWPGVPKSDYHFEGFDQKLLGSKVPPPGVYPRLLFSGEDVPALAARIKSTTAGRMSLVEMEHLFKKTFWDPSTSDGQVFAKLAAGNRDSLAWPKDVRPEQITTFNTAQQFEGQKQGIYSSHIAYMPECLTAMAFYCLVTGDDEHGRQCAAAIANYYKLREPLLDDWLKTSDSEFGSSLRLPDGSLYELNATNARTHWRNIHGLVAHMNLGLSLDFAGKWMTAGEKDAMRRFIAKATYGRRSYAQDGPVRFRDVNWMAWDLTHFLAVAAIEGLPGFDPEAYAAGAESVRAFCDWGIDDSGVVFESTGKNPGAFQFQVLSMAALARRGENLFGHPHWRKLLEGSIQMSSPTGRLMVNSGTQYSPFSRQKLSPFLVNEWKSFYPGTKLPDYWLGTFYDVPDADPLERNRLTPPDQFSEDEYRAKIEKDPRLRLPSPTYPGMARNVIYDGDIRPASRADLKLPLDFSAPYQGVFSSYSDRTPDAAWMHLYVRPHHYLGAGHHHADAGMFHFSALGVDWFTQSPFQAAYDGKYFNLVQVDGESEPTSLGSIGTRGILGYNAAATYLGAVVGDEASAGSADLTYAYSWRWLTQPPQVWSDDLNRMGWELDPTEANLKNWAGTARYKMRPWWSNYTYSNYIPTLRAPFNPMEFVFRTTGLVRGQHPYGFVVDDLKKDSVDHLFQWVAMLNGGVWKADVPGLPANAIALATSGQDPDPASPAPQAPLSPKPGDPVLLVYALGMKNTGVADLPLLQVERLAGENDRKGNPQFYDRLVISSKTSEARFRVLLLPVRYGDPMPQVDAEPDGTFRVNWGKVRDELAFRMGKDNFTRVQITRGKKTILNTAGKQANQDGKKKQQNR